MINPMRNTLLVCALCSLTAGVVNHARAEEPTIDPAPVKAAHAPPGYKGPVEYDGKVMVVNRAERTVTVEIQNKLHLFKVNSQVRIMKRGRPVTLNDIVAGQKVSIIARSLADGTLELVALGLDQSLTATQSAGRGGNIASNSQSKGDGGGSSSAGSSPGTIKTPPPFQNGVYPGNVERVIVSPNK
jgi:hypothetical protein